MGDGAVLRRSCWMRSLSCLRRSLDALVYQRYESQDRNPMRMSTSPPTTIAAIASPLSPLCPIFDELLDDPADDSGPFEVVLGNKESVESVAKSGVTPSEVVEAAWEKLVKVFTVALAESLEVGSDELGRLPEVELSVMFDSALVDEVLALAALKSMASSSS